MTLTLSQKRDMTAMALRLNRQDIDELVRGCRNVVEYRRPAEKWNYVFAEYIRVLRSLTEAQERAAELGMGDGPLAQPIAPLPIWNDDFQWPALLERLAVQPAMKRAA
jgi:hypothetical protein